MMSSIELRSGSMQLKLINCHPVLFSVTSTHGGLAGGGGGCGGTAATPIESVTFILFPLSSADSTYTHTFMGSDSSPVSSWMN